MPAAMTTRTGLFMFYLLLEKGVFLLRFYYTPNHAGQQDETVTRRFLLYFRLMMVVWILIANAFFHAIEFEYSWLVFSSFFSQRPGSKDAGALHFYVDSAVFPCYNGVN